MKRTRTVLAVAVVWCLTVALLAGCSSATRQQVLSFFFDGVVQPENPPRRRVRRDLLREIDELKRELARVRAGLEASAEDVEVGELSPVAEAATWAEAVEILPRDLDGNVDWSEALMAGALAPQPGINPSAPPQAVLQLDVDLVPEAGEAFKAVFPHEAHTEWLACTSCHPEPFEMRGGATPMSMVQINAGEGCGLCHGSVAFPPSACARCHSTGEEPEVDYEDAPWRADLLPVEAVRTWPEATELLPKDRDGNVDWIQALAAGTIAPHAGIDPDAPEEAVVPMDVELVPEAGEFFKAIFPHEAHTTWLACPSCHPEPFEMAAGTTPMSMEQINSGQGCGLCHGSVAFPTNACARCHSAGEAPAAGDGEPPWKVGLSPVEQAGAWPEAVRLLPKDRDGNVDWMQALAAGTIAPHAGIDPDAPEEAVVPMDVELVPEAGELFTAIFPHEAHTTWLACPSCHPKPFEMAAGATTMSMAQINSGEGCGLCHGSVAFPTNACVRCHSAGEAPATGEGEVPPWKVGLGRVERAGTWPEAAELLPKDRDGNVDWIQALSAGTIIPRPGVDPDTEEESVLPMDVELVPDAGEMFKVVFSHEAHTTWLACLSCHPEPFEMAAGATPMSMEIINAGDGCGVCHGTVAFSAAACVRCHPAMAGG